MAVINIEMNLVDGVTIPIGLLNTETTRNQGNIIGVNNIPACGVYYF